MGKQAQQLSWKLRRRQKALEGSSPWDFMAKSGNTVSKAQAGDAGEVEEVAEFCQGG